MSDVTGTTAIDVELVRCALHWWRLHAAGVCPWARITGATDCSVALPPREEKKP